jgi:heme/copper-type cytochrome/quinol oxidase subunit 2
MGITGGLIAIVLAVALLWAGRPPKGMAMRPILESWMVMICFTTVVMVLFIGGIAAVITNWG